MFLQGTSLIFQNEMSSIASPFTTLYWAISLSVALNLSISSLFMFSPNRMNKGVVRVVPVIEVSPISTLDTKSGNTTGEVLPVSFDFDETISFRNPDMN